eukprot:CAMPEP_0178461422 /NCGR_PEP_ID=MMETSP0689_2-20121128/49305_1 /TAXON_ID=160604 /ORGANISM="Amphidinium massartii, Strain CS-259" /LENGTH=97 /DNA_ID=CAMNT_0020088265 /DNA_START=580 /DNA_END=873 /DNA_ORIENTATION=-
MTLMGPLSGVMVCTQKFTARKGGGTRPFRLFATCPKSLCMAWKRRSPARTKSPPPQTHLKEVEDNEFRASASECSSIALSTFKTARLSKRCFPNDRK